MAGFSGFICPLALNCSADPDREGRVHRGQADLDFSVSGELTCVVTLFGSTMFQPLVRAAGDDLFVPELPSVSPVPWYHLTSSQEMPLPDLCCSCSHTTRGLGQAWGSQVNHKTIVWAPLANAWQFP